MTATEDRDRTVHASLKDGSEIVRYDREGRWYLEWPDGSERQVLKVRDAVELAADPDKVDQVYSGLPGGAQFDRKIAMKVTAQFTEPEGDADPS
jgi:hypothetical protein